MAAKKTTAKKRAPRKKRAPTRKKAPARKAATLPDTCLSAEKQVQRAPFPIVGIGASAGGLEAFEAFFKAMPAKPELAVVVVAHLDPTHVSLLPELIQKHTDMRVTQAEEGVKVAANCVYVIPPNKELRLDKGVLHLDELSQPRGANLPIDSFLRSLAEDQGSNAVGIILSGTGTDGTLGLRALKGEAGMMMVQDEDSAKYDGMPRSALATGLVDYVLPPEKMPEQLLTYVANVSRTPNRKVEPTDGRVPEALHRILVLIRAHTNHDFSLYKPTTLCRRVERRMNVHGFDQIDAYVSYLHKSDAEVRVLFKELLIGVTSFFRDPEAFEALQAKALPKLLQDKPNDYTVRVWVPGCSSGEEAYSIAIVLHECLEQSGQAMQVQVFGTDIDEEAIEAARAGVYPPSIAADVSPQRLRRYFQQQDDGQYRIKKMIRERLVFAPQSVTKDPPFTKLDLISCRNLLIYLGPELQEKLLPLFHYGLRPDGLLFLGTSETIGRATDLFSGVDKRWKIFRRRPAAGAGAAPQLPVTGERTVAEAREAETALRRSEDLSALQLVQAILAHTETPPCVIVDGSHNVVYVHGRVGRYLEPAEGKATVNLLEMARPGLKRGLQKAIRSAVQNREEAVSAGLRVEHNGGHLYVDVAVRPVLEPAATAGLLMVSFRETSKPGKGKPAGRRTVPRPSSKRTVDELTRELDATRENLQTTIEELEASNEELKSTNEELQSTNEELQSTNEELETSKEELQSLNEESATVNAELQARNDELAETNDDLKNLLDTTHVPTLFLDLQLRIRRFTSTATNLIPLASTDLGRPLSHFATSLVDTDLSALAQQVLDDLSARQVEVATTDGKWFVLSVRPYRTVSNVIDGVVMTFQDITERKLVTDERTRRLAAVVLDSNDAVTVRDRDGRLTAWNPAAERLYGYTESEALAQNARILVPPGKQAEFDSHTEALFRGEPVEPVRTERLTKDGRTLKVWLTQSALVDEAGQTVALATTERDVSRN